MEAPPGSGSDVVDASRGVASAVVLGRSDKVVPAMPAWLLTQPPRNPADWKLVDVRSGTCPYTQHRFSCRLAIPPARLVGVLLRPQHPLSMPCVCAGDAQPPPSRPRARGGAKGAIHWAMSEALHGFED
jgi:hypothetical protein